jgi:N6-L-threonylcarbamoyladenine synthase
LLAERAAHLDVRIPPARLCTDNGAMVAALGAALVERGRPPSHPGFGADSSLPVDEVQVALP